MRNWNQHKGSSQSKILISALALGIVAVTSHLTFAHEIRRSTGLASSNAAAAADSFEALPIDDAESAVVGGQVFKPDTPSAKLPTMDKISKFACGIIRNKTSLCTKWDKARESYEAAAKSLGVPAPVLACLTKVETNFSNGSRTVSSAGARGLTQFMPATAGDFERRMKSNPRYKEAWENYKKAGGTSRDVAAFNKTNILSPDLDKSDVQIFATAMYLRDALRASEKSWKDKIGDASRPNTVMLKRMYHYMMISYNAGVGRGLKFLKRGADEYEFLPQETEGYIKKFDKCIEDAKQA